jgi:hypothetical protein
MALLRPGVARNLAEVHYRLYRDHAGTPSVVCLQDFDYPDYDGTRFLSEDAWDDDAEAEEALAWRFGPTAADLPENSVIATKRMAWIKLEHTDGQRYRWSVGGSGSGDRYSDSDMDDLIASGNARILRRGADLVRTRPAP